MLLKKCLRVGCIVTVIVVTLSGSASALEGTPKDVEVTMNGQTTQYTTKTSTVGDFLADSNIDIQKGDKLNVDTSYSLSDKGPNNIVITPGVNVGVTIDGIYESMNIPEGTKTSDFINKLEMQSGSPYYYDGDVEKVLVDGDNLTLGTITSETSESDEKIPFETQKVNDDTMTAGTTEVQQAGVNGEKEVTTQTIYVSGKVHDTNTVKEDVLKEPIDEIVKVGTKPDEPTVSVNGKGVPYTKVYTMEATAYTAGPESTGKNPGDPGYGITASGKQAEHGVVAVDTSVIPLGTELYIDGYGEAVAADTGSGINGNEIDLFMDSYNDAINFGRQDVKVYVLDE